MSEKTFDIPQSSHVLEENVSFEDFLVRYEGQRVEWHMGKVVEKMSNNEKHQFLQNLLQTILSMYLMFTRRGRLYPDGYQMQLHDDKPVRQPDLLIVFKEHYDRIHEQYLDGAADIVIEIISPGTGHIDRGDKYYQYQDGGIPEYWIIDPISKRVDIYYLDDEGNYQPVKSVPDKIISHQLDGFELDASILWHGEMPDGAEAIELVQALLKDSDKS